MKITKNSSAKIPENATVVQIEAKGAQHELVRLFEDCLTVCEEKNCDEVIVRQISSYFDLRDETLSWTIKVIGVKNKSI